MKTERWMKTIGTLSIALGLLLPARSPAQPAYTTNDLWLQVVGLTNTNTPDVTASLAINPPWNELNPVYDLFATTNLAPGGWQWVTRTTAGQTNLTVTGLPRQNAFFILGSTLPAGDGSGLTVAYEHLVGVAILTQPKNQLVVQSGNATFSVAAAGIAPLGYQWYFNSTILDDATDATLTVNNVQPGDGGAYHVVARNSIGAMISSNAVLSVLLSPFSITNPLDNASFTIFPTNLTLQANATDLAGTISQVEFFQGTTSLGIVANPPYTLVWSNAPAGSYDISAVATDNGLTATSPVVNITVSSLFSTNALRLWLKADAIAGLTNGASVTDWPDSSGWNNDATQTTITNQPVLVANGANGLPAIHFDGTNNYFKLPDFMSAATAGEVLVVLRVTTNHPPADRSLWHFGTTPLGRFSAYPDTAGNLGDDFGNNAAYSMGMPPQPLTQFHVFEAVSLSNNWSAWINGVLLYQTTNNTVTFNSSPLLGAYDSSRRFGGDIAEVLVFNRGLTAGERTTVNDYLVNKYRLAPSVLATPSNLLAAAVSSGQIALTWNEPLNGGATQISIERSTSSGAGFAEVARVANALSYLDTNLNANTIYYYRVRGINVNVWSPYSNETNATTFVVGADMPLGNLALWLKADAGLMQLGGNAPIIYWPDQSGNGNYASQPATANQPVLAANGDNGLPAVHFDGTNNYFKLPDFISAATAGEAFVALRVITNHPPTDRSLWHFGTTPVGTFSAYPDTAGNIGDDFGNNAAYSMGVPPQSLTQFHVFEAMSLSNNWSAWINGALIYQTTNNLVTFNNSPLLGAYDASRRFGGDILEVLVFNRGLTADEKSAVGAYLNQKYSLVSELPTAPANLTATNASSTTASLAWVNTSPVLADVQIERKTDAAGVYSMIAEVGPGVTNCTDAGLVTGHVYFYRVRASNLAGRSPYSNEAGVVIDMLPTVNLASPSNGAVFISPANIPLTATATDSDGSVTNVAFFFTGTNNIGPGTNTPPSTAWGLTWSNVPSGVYSLTASATDNLGGVSNSAPVIITVSNIPPTVSIVSPTNNALFQVGGSIPLAVNAADANGMVVKVEYFYNTTTKIGESVTSPFDLVWTNAPAGTNSITAKATDNEGVATTSSAVKAIVNAQPSVSITNPVNNAFFNAGANITVNAAAADSDGTVSRVDFYYGATNLIGSDTTAPFSIVWSNAPSGTYPLTARAADNRGGVTTSSPVSVSVSTNLGDIADSYVDRSTPANNFGTINPVLVQTNGTIASKDAYFMFDTSGTTNVIGARLNIYAAISKNNDAAGVAVYGTGTNWTETGITWNNRPVLGTVIGTTNIAGSTLTLYVLDVTSYVQAQKAAGSSVISLAIHATNSTSWFVSINSKEAASNKPFLQIFTANPP